jgi:threonylcarbamoyladenosine tRNA methylthiotransferase MtaB
MEKEGYERVDYSDVADYYVINTCSVTEAANKKSRYTIRKAYKQNPQATIIIVGCYAQLKPEEIQKISGVSLVLGTIDKFSIPQKIQELERGEVSQIVSSCEISEVTQFESSYSLAERTRSFLKVQDGCDYSCSYCTIPKARGASRNATIQNIVTQAQEIANAGVQEIVLTGINIGDFGKTTGETFLQLLQALDSVQGIARYRISSIEPNLLTTEIIQFVAQSRAFMPHFHIPLQAGSDEVLQLMRRRYNTSLFANKIMEVKQIIPDCCIGVDVIVGTPGETDEYFQKAYTFIQSLPISYLHVFTYSERENTDALLIKPRVQESIRHQRSLILHELSDELQETFYKQFDGQTRPVLFESKQKNGTQVGFTDNYIKVEVKHNEVLKNTIKSACIRYEDGCMLGEVLK